MILMCPVVTLAVCGRIGIQSSICWTLEPQLYDMLSSPSALPLGTVFPREETRRL